MCQLVHGARMPTAPRTSLPDTRVPDTSCRTLGCQGPRAPLPDRRGGGPHTRFRHSCRLQLIKRAPPGWAGGSGWVGAEDVGPAHLPAPPAAGSEGDCGRCANTTGCAVSRLHSVSMRRASQSIRSWPIARTGNDVMVMVCGLDEFLGCVFACASRDSLRVCMRATSLSPRACLLRG